MSVTLADRAEAADVVAHVRRANQQALSDPVTLARYLDPQFAVRAHTRAIGAELAAVATGEITRLLVTLPPQVGKSWLAAMWGPFWWLCRNPQARIIIACYGQQLAVNRGRAIRRMVREHGWRYGLHLEHGSSAVHEWSLTSGGSVKAVGTGSSLTGSPGDCIWVDDVVKGRASADSLRIRDTISDWWSADLLSRLSPGAPVVMLGTLWHHDDQYARVMSNDGLESEGGAWRLLRMPAFADRPDDPLGREVGEPLPHPALPPHDTTALHAHWAGRRAQTQVRDWHALYQCDPQPAEGALASAELIEQRRHHPPPTDPIKHVVAVDPSGGGRDNAGIVGGFLGADRRVYFTHDRTMTGPSAEWAKTACTLAAEIDADTIVVEANFGGDMARNVIRSAWDTLAREHGGEPLYSRHCPQVAMRHAKKNKLLRAEPVAQQLVEDRVRFAARLTNLEWSWQTWQPTDPDSPGDIDASVYLVLHLLPVPGGETLVSAPTGVSRKSVPPRPGGARIRRSAPGA